MRGKIIFAFLRIALHAKIETMFLIEFRAESYDIIDSAASTR